MSVEIFLALVGFMFVTSMTPGPNNIMLMASGVNFGFRRSIPHMMGVAIGFQILLLCIAFGLGKLLDSFPMLYTALKFAGGSYLIYLAYKIATAGAVKSTVGEGKPLSIFAAAAFQWVNPKAWIVCLTVMSTYTNPDHYLYTVLIVNAVGIGVSILSTTTWAAFGTALKEVLSNPKTLRRFNVSMALLLVVSLWPMLK